MSLVYGPRFVTGNIALKLDPKNPKSYVNATTYRDLSSTGTVTVSGVGVTDSFTFSSTTDKITTNVAYPSSLFSTSTGGTTICYWVYFNGVANGSIMQDRYITQLTGLVTSNTLDTLFYDGTKKQLTTGLSTGKWYYVCVVTTGYLIYVNGTSMPTTNITWGWGLDNLSPAIGKNYYNAFSGKIGDFVVYNRVLSSAEITQNFEASRISYGV